MKFTVSKDPVELLRRCGYVQYGQNTYSYQKKIKFGQFHAVIEYNARIIHLHIDKENDRGTFDHHDTIQNNLEVVNESIKIKNQQRTEKEIRYEDKYNLSAWKRAWKQSK
jgi:hypothetical protein